VPVGVSDFSNEESMRSHSRDEALAVVALAERYQRLSLEVLGRVTVFASDEFYIVAGRRPPSAATFESLDQAENGIGLVAAFAESFAGDYEMEKLGTGFFQSVDGAPAWGYRAPARATEFTGEASEVVVVTGEYAAPVLRELFDTHGYADVEILSVKNRYFGGNIKVAGLLTGRDIADSLFSVAPAATCLVPDVCLSEGRFLDGMSLEELPRRVRAVRTTGQDLRLALDSARARRLVSS
jgi:NifB/MoaA-like Fe-S oxidoreductase